MIGLALTLTGLALIPLIVLVIFRVNLAKQKPHSIKNILKFVGNNFKLVRHEVETEDGYLLSLFNIRHKENFDSSKKPILIQHGMGASSLTWLMGGEQLSPALILARQGHDVYLANSRGTVYSMRHKNFKINSEIFWDFTFQDMRLDIIANIKKILDLTDHQQIEYIALSQGAVSLLAALSDVDNQISDYLHEKISTFYCLAPVVYSKKASMPALKYSRLFAGWGFKVLDFFGISAIPAKPEDVNWKKIKRANNRTWWNKKIGWMNTDRAGAKNNLKVFGTYQSFHPMGMSVKCMKHFVQIYQGKGDDYFKKFDYGSTKSNMREYGSLYPPSYDFSKVKTRIRLFYGDCDKYLTEAGIKLLAQKLKNADLKVHKMKDYGHVTYVLGKETDQFYSRLMKDDYPLAPFYREMRQEIDQTN